MEEKMSTVTKVEKNLGTLGKILAIFTSPKEAFQSIDNKPTWLVPFLIIVILAILMQFFIMDIGFHDLIEKMEVREIPQEQIDIVQSKIEGPARYINLAVIPILTLIIWSVTSGIFLFCGNTLMGGESNFKKIFSIIAWSGLIETAGGLLKTLLILLKGTTYGIVTSLAIILPTPPLSEKPSIIYRILSAFDFFTIWKIILWIIGLALIYRFSTKKSSILVISIWIVWIIISVTSSTLFGSKFG
jgi:hypothetical protein